jgi:hypothetical protein
MPANFKFYVDKASEQAVVIMMTSDTNATTQVSAPVLGSEDDTDIIGTLFAVKTWNKDAYGNQWATFEWYVQFFDNSGLPTNSTLQLSFTFFNQTTGVENPTETIPAGQPSIVVTGSVNSLGSSGEFLNQSGYCNKTDYSTKSFRLYEVYFPQAVVTYTNVFNSLPQPSVAPLPA